jgi:hypothetical protein
MSATGSTKVYPPGSHRGGVAAPLEPAPREELVALAPCRDRSVEDGGIGHIAIG